MSLIFVICIVNFNMNNLNALQKLAVVTKPRFQCSTSSTSTLTITFVIICSSLLSAGYLILSSSRTPHSYQPDISSLHHRIPFTPIGQIFHPFIIKYPSLLSASCLSWQRLLNQWFSTKMTRCGAMLQICNLFIIIYHSLLSARYFILSSSSSSSSSSYSKVSDTRNV